MLEGKLFSGSKKIFRVSSRKKYSKKADTEEKLKVAKRRLFEMEKKKKKKYDSRFKITTT